MAIHRERPYGQSNFLVDFGDGRAESAAAGFCEVIFPPFDADAHEGREAPAAGERALPLLILKRGFTGSLDLYTWWDKTRRGRAPKRKTLHIRLLAEDHGTVVAAWRFRAVRPIRLSYSPLIARRRHRHRDDRARLRQNGDGLSSPSRHTIGVTWLNRSQLERLLRTDSKEL